MLLAASAGDQAEGDGHALTSDELRDQVLTLFLAGYETVANALAWTWLLLGQNPEAEARLHAETGCSSWRPAAAWKISRRLEYTAMVLSESMRLYPPAWAMGREALEDVVDRAVSAAQRNDRYSFSQYHCAARSALVS